MRINERKKDLQHHYDIIAEISQPKDLASNKKKIENLLSGLNSVRYLHKEYGDAIPSLIDFEINYRTLDTWAQDTITAESSEINRYAKLFENILKELEQNIDLLNLLLPKQEDGFYLNVKLSACNSPAQVKEFFNNLEFILRESNARLGNGSLDAFELYDFQHGSKWADFKVKYGPTILMLLTFIGFVNDVFDITRNISDAVTMALQNPTASSDKYIEELEKKKKEMIYTETTKYIEEHYTKTTDAGTKNEVIVTTTKIVEKTVIMLETGAEFQIEIIGAPELNDDAINELPNDFTEQIKVVNTKQKEISNKILKINKIKEKILKEIDRLIKIEIELI